jgi:L-asparaginase
VTHSTVRAIFLGGTIGFAGDAGGVSRRRLSGAELLGSLGPDAGDIEVEVHDLMRKPSSSLDFGDIELVLEAARGDGADGIVVVQGTDTTEETAFLLDLLWDDERPLVLTGAMRKPVALGADGPANLSAAIRVAATTTFRGHGVLVVMNDQVHAARFVRKTHTSNVATFDSPTAGPLGSISEGRPVLMLTLPGKREVHAPTAPLGARVPVVTAALGDDGVILSAAGEVADGLVIAALGGGHVPGSFVPALADLANRMPVVISSRTGSGVLLSSTYSGPGSEVDLMGRGMISAGLLDPLKARMALVVGLACQYTHHQIEEMFRAYGTTDAAPTTTPAAD